MNPFQPAGTRARREGRKSGNRLSIQELMVYRRGYSSFSAGFSLPYSLV